MWVFRIYSMLYCLRKRNYYPGDEFIGNYNFQAKTTPRPNLYTLGIIHIRCWLVPISPMSEESEGKVGSVGEESVDNFAHFNRPNWYF